jgi:sporulation-control protein spo0M
MDEILGEINACKILLAQTDYQALKYAEGAMPEQEFAPIRALRASWRARINELEAVLAEGDGDDNV